MSKTTKTTKSVAIVEVKAINTKPIRKATATVVLTREIHPTKITCPECGGKNGLHRLNQKCDFCGFMLRVHLFPNMERYIKGLGVTKSGRDTLDIADETADRLRGLAEYEVVTETANALAQLSIEIGLSLKLGKQFKATGFTWDADGIHSWLDSRYEGRNPGMVRMNCGNILRAAGKRANDEQNA
jgi:ribosomal protein L37E